MVTFQLISLLHKIIDSIQTVFGNIDSVENDGNGNTKFNTNIDHTLKIGQTINITNTTNHDGTKTVLAVLSSKSFVIAEAFVSNQSGNFSTVVSRAIDEKWFDEDLFISAPPAGKNRNGGVIVIDFNYDVSSIIEYSRNADAGVNASWIPLNDNDPIFGGQSRFVRFTNNMAFNLRAKSSANLVYASVGQV